MIVLGLTGSIGMGKSTTAAMFANEGGLVWNADAAVHALYSPGGAAVGPIQTAFPGVVVEGGIDRARLAEALGREDGRGVADVAVGDVGLDRQNRGHPGIIASPGRSL